MDVFKEMFWMDTEGNFLNVINWGVIKSIVSLLILYQNTNEVVDD